MLLLLNSILSELNNLQKLEIVEVPLLLHDFITNNLANLLSVSCYSYTLWFSIINAAYDFIYCWKVSIKKQFGFHDSLPFENSPPNLFRKSFFVTDQLKAYFRHAVCNQSVLLWCFDGHQECVWRGAIKWAIVYYASVLCLISHWAPVLPPREHHQRGGF